MSTDPSTSDDSSDDILTESQRAALEARCDDEDPAVAAIAETLLQSFDSTEATN